MRQKKAIRTRLRRVRHEFLGDLSDDDFAEKIGASPQAVQTWLDDREKPVTPGTTYIVRIALEANVQPTWLLLGEGPELVGVPAPVNDLAHQLRDHVKAVLAKELRANPAFVDGELMRAREMLNHFVEPHRMVVEREVIAQRAFIRKTQSLLARALRKHAKGNKERSIKILSLQRALLDFAADQEAMRRGKPPVEPPLDPSELAEFATPLIPPLDPSILGLKRRGLDWEPDDNAGGQDT